MPRTPNLSFKRFLRRLGSFSMVLAPNADWSEVVDDGGEVSRDGSEVASVSGEVASDGGEVARDSGEASDVELSSNESSDESDGLVTVSEGRSESDRDVP